MPSLRWGVCCAQASAQGPGASGPWGPRKGGERVRSTSITWGLSSVSERPGVHSRLCPTGSPSHLFAETEHTGRNDAYAQSLCVQSVSSCSARATPTLSGLKQRVRATSH